MRVKICGIKKVEDALKAIEYGADAIGLLVGQTHASKDFISKELAKEIVDSLPPFVSTVMVTHMTDVQTIIDFASFIGVSTIQLHGESNINDIRQIKNELRNVKIVKSIHVVDESSIYTGAEFLGYADAVLLDTMNKGTDQIGGTGITHDWNISKMIVESYKIPIILAGGLNPDNIEEAVNKVKPYAVDVNSGVKGEDGFKDYEKLKKFIQKAKK